MLVRIIGHSPPGRSFCRPDGSVMDNVHVGVQSKARPEKLVPGDATDTKWELDVDIVARDEDLDFRGSFVHGRPGERFLYLTWGNVTPAGFEMFRRAKLMLNRIEPKTVAQAVVAGTLTARVELTGDDGGPRCARVDPPALQWTVDGE